VTRRTRVLLVLGGLLTAALLYQGITSLVAYTEVFTCVDLNDESFLVVGSVRP
jgi:hypothetical protein